MVTGATTRREPRLAYLDDNSPLPPAADIALRVAVTVTKWTRRRRTRKALKLLDETRLNDIGLTREEAWREAARPFWAD